jgi:hypothetical protein
VPVKERSISTQKVAVDKKSKAVLIKRSYFTLHVHSCLSGTLGLAVYASRIKT